MPCPPLTPGQVAWDSPQGSKTKSTDCSKARIASTLSLPGRKLASGPGRSKPLGTLESRLSHHLTVWGSLPVSTEFNIILTYLKNKYFCLCLCLTICACHTWASACGSPKRALNPLELDGKVVVSRRMKFRSSERAPRALSLQIIFSFPMLLLWSLVSVPSLCYL